MITVIAARCDLRSFFSLRSCATKPKKWWNILFYTWNWANLHRSGSIVRYLQTVMGSFRRNVRIGSNAIVSQFGVLKLSSVGVSSARFHQTLLRACPKLRELVIPFVEEILPDTFSTNLPSLINIEHLNLYRELARGSPGIIRTPRLALQHRNENPLWRRQLPALLHALPLLARRRLLRWPQAARVSLRWESNAPISLITSCQICAPLTALRVLSLFVCSS